MNEDNKSLPLSASSIRKLLQHKSFFIRAVPVVILAAIIYVAVAHVGISIAADNKSVNITYSADANLPRLTIDKTYSIPASPTQSGIAGVLVGDAPTAVAWSPDGKKIAAFSSYGQNLAVWNAGGDLIKVLHPYINYLNNSLDFLNNDELLTPPNTPPKEQLKANLYERLALAIWSIGANSIIQKAAGPYSEQEWRANIPVAYAVSPDKNFVAVLSQVAGQAKPGPEMIFDKNPVPIYSTKTWQIAQRIPVVHPDSVAFSPDGAQIAFGQYAGKISIYDTTNWQLLKTISACDGFNAAVQTIAYSPDSKFIVAGITTYTKTPNNCAAKIVRISDGAIVGIYPDQEAGASHAIVWHPSGKFVAIAPPGTKIRLWDPANPNDPGVIINNVRSLCLAFSPDGKQLASCNNGGITVFNVNF